MPRISIRGSPPQHRATSRPPRQPSSSFVTREDRWTPTRNCHRTARRPTALVAESAHLLDLTEQTGAHDRADSVVVLDFGSQYSQLITRRVREAGVYCELFHHDTPWAEIESLQPARRHPLRRPGQRLRSRRAATARLGAGERPAGARHLLRHAAAGAGARRSVEPAARREYGPARIVASTSSTSRPSSPICRDALDVWMSHGDHVATLPAGFATLAARATTRRCAAIANGDGSSRSSSTPKSRTRRSAEVVLRNFLDRRSAAARRPGRPASFIEQAIEQIRVQVGTGRVLLRPERRRRLVGRGGADSPGDRRAADAGLRQQRAAAASARRSWCGTSSPAPSA